ncbi:MAG: hypothetical protein V4478_03505 [Patescibacteria group bacterium]
MFTNKKSELTRVEASALSIAQWSILELLPEEFKNRNVFFTQVTVSTVSPNKLDNGFASSSDWRTNKRKALKLKAYFTTLQENIDADEPPCVEAEMLFANSSDFYFSWMPVGIVVDVLNYPDIHEYPKVTYDACDLFRERYIDEPSSDVVEREKRFERFFHKVFMKVPQKEIATTEK